MDSALATEAPATPAATEPAATPESKPLELEEFVHQQFEKHGEPAAAEGGTKEAPAAPEAKVAEAPAVTPEPEKPAVAVQPPFTAEELGEEGFLGRLTKDGWAKLEAYNPDLFKLAKTVARMQGTVFEQKRQLETALAQPRPAVQEKPPEPEVDPYLEALEKTDSLDPKDRAEGFRVLARLEAEKLLEPYKETLQRTTIASQSVEIEKAAYMAALQSMPEAERAEFTKLPSAELDAAVEGDPDLMDDIELAVTLEPQARMRLRAKVMRRAGKIVIDKRAQTKAAADAERAVAEKATKDAATQTRLKSNQSNPSTTVADTPGGKLPKGETSIEDFVHSKVAALH
jgi:hypothetical protein